MQIQGEKNSGGSSLDFVPSDNLTYFSNFVAGANDHMVSLMAVSLDSNPTIFLY